MLLHGKCIICKYEKNLVGIGLFARCCETCAKELYVADMQKLESYPKRKVQVRSLTGDRPHEDYGSWEGFLKTCEVRDHYDDVTHYGRTNCNFILFSDGTLLQNYGFHGRVVMNRIREEGADYVLTSIKAAYIAFKTDLTELGVTIGANEGNK